LPNSFIWILSYTIILVLLFLPIEQLSFAQFTFDSVLESYGVCRHLYQFSELNYDELKHRTEELFSLS